MYINTNDTYTKIRHTETHRDTQTLTDTNPHTNINIQTQKNTYSLGIRSGVGILIHAKSLSICQLITGQMTISTYHRTVDTLKSRRAIKCNKNIVYAVT